MFGRLLMDRGPSNIEVRAEFVLARDPQLLAEAEYILAMDSAKVDAVAEVCPPEHRGRIQRFLDYAPEQHVRDMPDPYYGGAAGFEQVLDLIEAGVRGLLMHVQQRIARQASRSIRSDRVDAQLLDALCSR